MEKVSLNLPSQIEKIRKLKAGDMVLISGIIYTGRDQAHIRLNAMIKDGCELPFDLNNSTIYYSGPSPTPPNKVVGSIGPTTSSRMDSLTLPLLQKGVRVMIGKGQRSPEVIEGIKKYGCVYLSALGGAGALYQEKVETFQLVAFPDLLSEGIYKLQVKDFPAVVSVDSKGNTFGK